MSDQITKCIKYTDSNSNVIGYGLMYTLDNGSTTAPHGVWIKAGDMTDPADLDELKTLANAKASAEKEGVFGYTETEISSVEGPVTL